MTSATANNRGNYREPPGTAPTGGDLFYPGILISTIKSAQIRSADHVGGFTDLSEMGAIFHETRKKKCHGVSWCCHGLEARNRLRIDTYDDLLYPRHRLFAQLPVFASGDQSKKNIFEHLESAPLNHDNTMTHP